MAGYDNIKEHGFDKRTTEEQREIAKKGGQASGRARRRKADFRKTLNQLLTTQIDNPDVTPLLENLGIDSTIEAAMLMAQIKEAMTGNTKAAYFVAQYAGQSDKTIADEREQKIRTDRAKRARDIEVGDADPASDRVTAFLKALRPSKEEIDSLFGDDVDGKEE